MKKPNTENRTSLFVKTFTSPKLFLSSYSNEKLFLEFSSARTELLLSILTKQAFNKVNNWVCTDLSTEIVDILSFGSHNKKYK